jgi:hypothetical protein
MNDRIYPDRKRLSFPGGVGVDSLADWHPHTIFKNFFSFQQFPIVFDISEYYNSLD